MQLIRDSFKFKYYQSITGSTSIVDLETGKQTPWIMGKFAKKEMESLIIAEDDEFDQYCKLQNYGK